MILSYLRSPIQPLCCGSVVFPLQFPDFILRRAKFPSDWSVIGQVNFNQCTDVIAMFRVCFK